MKNLYSLFFLILLFSCGKKSGQDPQPQQEQPTIQEHLITGFIFRDYYGNPLGDKGSPNVKTSIQANGKRFDFVFYPNPAETEIAVSLSNTFPSTKRELWIVAASQSNELASYNFPQANSALIGGQPVFQTELAANDNRNAIIVDLSKFPSGAYRIYAKIDSTLLWDNILKK